MLSSHELSQLARAVAASRSGSAEMLADANAQLAEWDVTRLLAAAQRAAVYFLTVDRLGASDDIAQPEVLEALVAKLAAALPPQTALTRERLLVAIGVITALNAGRRVDPRVAPFAAACDMLAVCACVLSSSHRPLQALPSILAGAPFPAPDLSAPG